jgi:uncharacterized membrane protein
MVVSPPDLLIIDSFDERGEWEPVASDMCTITTYTDRNNMREGQASMRIQAEFSDVCSEEQCYIGITGKAPDLSSYSFLRMWVKVDSTQNIYAGIHVSLVGERERFHIMPVTRTDWQSLTIPFSDFKAEEESSEFDPGDITTISLFLIADHACSVRMNVDGLVALLDTNDNGIPDIDETTIGDAAQNAEQMGNRYFDEENYERAKKYYEEAKSLYQRVENQEKVELMDKKTKECLAFSNLSQGDLYYEEGQHLMAMQSYEKARREFVLLGNLDIIDYIETRLEELSQITGKPVSPPPQQSPSQSSPGSGRKGAGGLFLVIIIVALVGVVVYFVKFRTPSESVESSEEDVTTEREPLSPSEKKAEEIRTLKAKFVYGEISRKEYEKKLRELEDM